MPLFIFKPPYENQLCLKYDMDIVVFSFPHLFLCLLLTVKLKESLFSNLIGQKSPVYAISMILVILDPSFVLWISIFIKFKMVFHWAQRKVLMNFFYPVVIWLDLGSLTTTLVLVRLWIPEDIWGRIQFCAFPCA